MAEYCSLSISHAHRHTITLAGPGPSPRATAGAYPPRIHSISAGFANGLKSGQTHPFNLNNQERCQISSRRNLVQSLRLTRGTPRCALGAAVQPDAETLQQGVSNFQESFNTLAANNKFGVLGTLHIVDEFKQNLLLLDLDPATAKLVIPFIGPFLSAFGFLFILRIVMSWYPKLPVGKFPYVLAYAPTEPILNATRKVIPPLGGVDVTPVVWFGLLSFLNEILVGPQGLLVLLSQQV